MFLLSLTKNSHPITTRRLKPRFSTERSGSSNLTRHQTLHYRYLYKTSSTPIIPSASPSMMPPSQDMDAAKAQAHGSYPILPTNLPVQILPTNSYTNTLTQQALSIFILFTHIKNRPQLVPLYQDPRRIFCWMWRRQQKYSEKWPHGRNALHPATTCSQTSSRSTEEWSQSCGTILFTGCVGIVWVIRQEQQPRPEKITSSWSQGPPDSRKHSSG